jgi:hypothetical protein
MSYEIVLVDVTDDRCRIHKRVARYVLWYVQLTVCRWVWCGREVSGS